MGVRIPGSRTFLRYVDNTDKYFPLYLLHKHQENLKKFAFPLWSIKVLGKPKPLASMEMIRLSAWSFSFGDLTIIQKDKNNQYNEYQVCLLIYACMLVKVFQVYIINTSEFSRTQVTNPSESANLYLNPSGSVICFFNPNGQRICL